MTKVTSKWHNRFETRELSRYLLLCLCFTESQLKALKVHDSFLVLVVQYSVVVGRTEYKRWAEQQVSEKSEWRESWRENAVHLVRIRLYHRILWGRRKEKALCTSATCWCCRRRRRCHQTPPPPVATSTDDVFLSSLLPPLLHCCWDRGNGLTLAAMPHCGAAAAAAASLSGRISNALC